MFHRRTLFVLGAGTSAEVQMPTGDKLAAAIGKKMDIRFEHFSEQIGSGDSQLYYQLTNQLRTNPNEIQAAGWLIRDGISLQQSIDDFLDLHRANPYVNLFGKAAIVKTILEAERSSKLFFNPDEGRDIFNPEVLANTWFLKFMHMRGRGIPKQDVSQIFDNVGFVVFNYDRCLEHFLYNALQKVYGIREDEAASILDECIIIHPYGQVGAYQRIRGVPFGAGSANYCELSQQIKTYTEQITDGDVINQIAVEFARAECVVFLGFGYHSQNMRMLRPAAKLPYKFVYGTAHGMSAADKEVIRHQVSDFFTPTMTTKVRDQKIVLDKLTCAGLFSDYSKSLSGGD